MTPRFSVAFEPTPSRRRVACTGLLGGVFLRMLVRSVNPMPENGELPTYRVQVLARDGSTIDPLTIEATNPDAARAIASAKGCIVGKTKAIVESVASKSTTANAGDEGDFSTARYVAALRRNIVYETTRTVINVAFWFVRSGGIRKPVPASGLLLNADGPGIYARALVCQKMSGNLRLTRGGDASRPAPRGRAPRPRPGPGRSRPGRSGRSYCWST